MKIEIKNRHSGEVLFSHECEDNTIHKTLKEGLKQGADLTGAYLRGAYLAGADLTGADLKNSGLYQIVGVGSNARCTTLDTINKKVICGCFYGDLEAFEQKIILEYKDGNDLHFSMYMSVVAYFKAILDNIEKFKK